MTAHRVIRLLTLLTFVLSAGLAHARPDGEAAVRLHLSLDADGRVHLSADPETYAPPPLRTGAMLAPRPGQVRPERVGDGRIKLDLRANRFDDGSLAPCLSGTPIHLGALGGCELVGYRGLPGTIDVADLVLSWESPRNYGLDLSFGLEWLDAGRIDSAGGNWLALGGLPEVAAAILLPGWVGPMLDQSELRTERMGLGSHYWLAPALRLDLGYLHTDTTARGALFAGQAWLVGSEDSLSLALSYGRFQGGLIGRQWRPDEPGSPGLDSLDLGFSWRMPWNAELEFGARNLIVRPQQPDPAKPVPDQGDLRTPYLRYHQEL